ncbi:peptidase inhibitor family I36 protein [Streptodolium elevatio]|uniref:Peptidase inhibitor family I36 protein n=1 Tax=Streptodolium elevatio TaxID=3157996 RepID=A0ABV3DI79_9ACTN
MSRNRKFTALALGGAAVLGSIVLTATPASAGPGTCKRGVDVCLYYNSDFKGAKYGLSETRSYNGLKFAGGNGAGQAVKNNAASVHNMNVRLTARITYNSTGSQCRAACQDLPPVAKANLKPSMKNENAAQYLYNKHGGPGGDPEARR